MSELLNNSVVSGRNLVYREKNRLGDLEDGFGVASESQFTNYQSSSDEEDQLKNTTINESFMIKRLAKNGANKSSSSLFDDKKYKIKSATMGHSKDYSSSEENDNFNTSYVKKSSRKNGLNTTIESTKINVAPINELTEQISDMKNKTDNDPSIDLSIFDLLDKTSKKFVLQPATIGLSLKCQIFRQRGIYPEYKFYIENLDGNLLLLMSARKKKKSKTSCYIINYISFDLDDLEKYIETPLAKVKSNLLGTQFKLYDFGVKPVNILSDENSSFLKSNLSPSEFDFSETTSDDIHNSDQNINRREYISITYGFNVLGLKGPRNVKVIIPGMDDKYCRDDFVLKYKSDSLIHAWKKIEDNLRYNSPSYKPTSSRLNAIRKSIFQLNIKKNFREKKDDKEIESDEISNNKSNSKSDVYSNAASSVASNSAIKAKTEYRNVVKLVNKSPEWHRELNSFALNFNGRVTISSVKNYQIIHEINPDYVVTQFGKVNKDLYTCDYSYPLCALQAFGIALSSMDNKLGCD